MAFTARYSYECISVNFVILFALHSAEDEWCSSCGCPLSFELEIQIFQWIKLRFKKTGDVFLLLLLLLLLLIVLLLFFVFVLWFVCFCGVFLFLLLMFVLLFFVLVLMFVLLFCCWLGWLLLLLFFSFFFSF